MATGTVRTVDAGNRKFELNANVEILQQTLKQYRVRDSNGATGWIDKRYIALNSGVSGGTRHATPSLKPPRPDLKPKAATPRLKPKPAPPKLKPKPAAPNLKSKPATPTQTPTLTPLEKRTVPPCFQKDSCSGIYHVNWNVMSRLLPSYGVTDQNETAKLLKWWKNNLSSSPFTLNAVPTVLQVALGGRQMRGKKAIEYVAEKNSASAPPLPSHALGKGVTTLSRAGGRTYSQIKDAHGFHGWGGSMSVLHAQIWAAEYWGPMSQREKNTWWKRWKDHTRGSTDEMPFVATGWDAQKAGNTFKITVPLTVLEQKDPVLVHNNKDIKQSNMFCIAGTGEVLFLTGIPMKYIEYP
jgi:hypothetical protein